MNWKHLITLPTATPVETAARFISFLEGIQDGLLHAIFKMWDQNLQVKPQTVGIEASELSCESKTSRQKQKKVCIQYFVKKLLSLTVLGHM
jgi:hypothetical protein